MSNGATFICFFCGKPRRAKKFKINIVIPAMKEVFDKEGNKTMIQVGVKDIGKVCESIKCRIKARKVHEANRKREAADKRSG